MINTIIVIALVLLITLHIYGASLASWHLSKSLYFDPWQKRAQYFIIWLIPVIGTALVLNMLAPEISKRSLGWIPWLDGLIISAFVISASNATEVSATHDHTTAIDTSNTDGGSND